MVNPYLDMALSYLDIPYIRAIVVFVLAYLIFVVAKRIVIGRIKRFSQRTKTTLDDVTVQIIEEAVKWPLFTVVALKIAFQFIALPSLASKIIDIVILLVITYYATKMVMILLDYGKGQYVKRSKETDASLLNVLTKIIKGIIWLIAGLLILSNLGYNITSLIAGLGVGGIAIAFALQNILEDIFSSFSIYFDKPFQVGDFIIVGADMGVVQKIGIKSTRLKTLQGQELVISNKELTAARVNNYKKMEERRVVFKIGVTYDTTDAKAEKIPKIVKDVFKNRKKTRLDRVHFASFGDFALIYEIVYYLNSSDYNVYMDTQQSINLDIKKRFTKEKIEMAFPTQTVYMKKG